MIGQSIFSLSELQKSTDRINEFKGENNDEMTIHWNLCSYVTEKCENEDSFAFVEFDKNKTCHLLTGFNNFVGFSFSLINPDKEDDGLKVAFTGGDKGYDLEIQIACDAN